MQYIPPETVVSPKSSLKDLEVIYDSGAFDGENAGFSIAKMKWEDEDSMGIRWNGGKTNPSGNPQSRGIPTWFILPDPIRKIVERNIGKIPGNKMPGRKGRN
jgi:hypothetical protein